MDEVEAINVLHDRVMNGDLDVVMRDTPLGRAPGLSDAMEDMDGEATRASASTDLLNYIESIDQGEYNDINVPEDVEQEVAELAAEAIEDVEADTVVERL